MGRAPRVGVPWLMRLSILAAMVMLVAGIGMISGYFGGMPEPATPVTATPVSTRVATSQAVATTTRVPGTAVAVIPTVADGLPPTAASAQSPAVGAQATDTARAIAQATPVRQPSATSVVGSSNMATAMAVAAQSTSVAQATQESALSMTSTAQAIAQSTAASMSAAGTAQAVQAGQTAQAAQASNNANATSTAITAARTAASQQTRQAQQAQQPPPPPQPPVQAQATPTSLVLSVVFEDDFYRGIDILGAAREQFGARAVLYSRCEALNCWYVKSGAQVRPLDLKRAVARQYGADWTLVAVGAGKSDWRAVRFADLNYAVLPVMMVSSDRLSDVAGVNTGLARFRTVLANSQYWYYAHVGKTFRLLQPVIITSENTSAQWNSLSAMYTSKDKLAQATWSQYAKQLPVPGSNLRIVVAPYTGENYTIAQGALSMPGFAVAPALATSLWCPQSGQLSKSCQSASYLVGQALGLSFGLGHSCSAYPGDPKCRVSLMQEGKPPGATLLQPEVEKLTQSPFFTRY